MLFLQPAMSSLWSLSADTLPWELSVSLRAESGLLCSARLGQHDTSGLEFRCIHLLDQEAMCLLSAGLCLYRPGSTKGPTMLWTNQMNGEGKAEELSLETERVPVFRELLFHQPDELQADPAWKGNGKQSMQESGPLLYTVGTLGVTAKVNLLWQGSGVLPYTMLASRN